MEELIGKLSNHANHEAQQGDRSSGEIVLTVSAVHWPPGLPVRLGSRR
jgi:hypothetical protein